MVSYFRFKAAGVLNMSFQHLINEYRSLEMVSVGKTSIKQHCVSDTITSGFPRLGWSQSRDIGTQHLIAYILGGEICHEGGAGGALIQISSVTVTHYELTSPTYLARSPILPSRWTARCCASLRIPQRSSPEPADTSHAARQRTNRQRYELNGRRNSKFAPVRRKRSRPQEHL